MTSVIRTPMPAHNGVWPLVFPLLCVGCNPGSGGRPEFKPGRVVYDTKAIALDNFSTDSATQRRVLMMPFGEAAARLGSLQFDAQSYFEFSRGSDTYDQRDTYRVLSDFDSNFHVRLETPVGQVEFYLVGEDVYVRQDVGELRHKQRRDVETEAWCEMAWSSINQTLDLFRPQLVFGDPQADSVSGRKALRYALSLAAPPADPPKRYAPKDSALPVSPPALWRELAHPLSVAGNLWLDAETGAVLKAEVEGRLDISDRQVRATQLTVRYSGVVTRVGEVTSIKVPPSIPEYRRTPPPRDLLAFFREHLPAPPPEEGGTGGNAGDTER